MQSERQSSFGAGEIAPTLRGRTDLAMYSHAVGLGRNWLTTMDGVLNNRPGMVMSAKTKFSAASKVGLFHFIFGAGQNYMLEFGVAYIRFYQLGALVLNGGPPLEVVTPWAEADLPYLKLTQSGDTVVISRAGYNAKELTRTSHLVWTLTDFTPSTSVNAPTGLATSGVVSASDAQHAGKAWDIVVTGISGGDTPEESLPSNVLGLGAGTALYPDRPISYAWVAPVGGTAPSKYAVYRAPAGTGRYGFIGESLTTSFRDDGQVPLYAEPPPSGRDPFGGGANDKPAVSSYGWQRLFFFNSNNAPNTGWGSRLAAFKSFDTAVPPKDDDAMTFTLASRIFDEIRSALPLSEWMFLPGCGAEWILRGINGAPPAPLAVDPVPVSYWGSSWLDPIVVGEVPLFVTDLENHVRELVISGDAAGNPKNVGLDLSLVALHLFEHHTIVSSAVARRPFQTGFYVRDDGVMLALSYIRQTQQVAWTWIDTDGVIEWVATVPEGAEDAVYLVVKRTVNGVSERYVERMASRQGIVDAHSGCFLDGASFFDGKNAGATTMTVTGAYGVAGVVNLESSAGLFGAGDYIVGNEIVLKPGKDGFHVRLAITGIIDPTHATGRVVNVAVPVSLRAVATTDWGVAKAAYTGMTQLVGATIRVVADGVVRDGLAVDGAGNLTLVSPAVRVAVGRDYTPDLELLDLATARNKQKVVARTVFEVVRTAPGGLQVGESVDTLADYNPPPESAPGASGLVGNANKPFQVPVTIDSTWNPYGRATLRQSDPLPVTVIAATREFAIGQG